MNLCVAWLLFICEISIVMVLCCFFSWSCWYFLRPVVRVKSEFWRNTYKSYKQVNQEADIYSCVLVCCILKMYSIIQKMPEYLQHHLWWTWCCRPLIWCVQWRPLRLWFDFNPVIYISEPVARCFSWRGVLEREGARVQGTAPGDAEPAAFNHLFSRLIYEVTLWRWTSRACTAGVYPAAITLDWSSVLCFTIPLKMLATIGHRAAWRICASVCKTDYFTWSREVEKQRSRAEVKLVLLFPDGLHCLSCGCAGEKWNQYNRFTRS